MATLYCSTGSSSIWPGAIMGDLPNPSGAADLAAGQFYTTGDLALGESGEVSGQTVMTIEFWFQIAALPAGGEIFCQGPMTTTGVGTREWWFGLNPTGTISFSARTATPATITATSTTALLPYSSAIGNYFLYTHVVGRIDGTNL